MSTRPVSANAIHLGFDISLDRWLFAISGEVTGMKREAIVVRLDRTLETGALPFPATQGKG
jgi:hypothetical protein